MAEKTSIEWCDATFNPWMGCTRVSPACDDCYAARSTPARTMGIEWGAGQPRRRTSASNWSEPPKWAKAMPARLGRRPRVFCASLADWLDNEVPIEWLVDLLDLIRRTPELDWLLLSKRIGNWRKRLEEAARHLEGGHELMLPAMVEQWLAGKPPANVWLGSTVVNQEEADRDVPKLLAVPARVRFLSVEPMLGRVDLCEPFGIWWNQTTGAWVHDGESGGIHWVICGGESGPKARPMSPDWARSLRDQCAAAGAPFLLKQWGEWLPILGQAEGVPVGRKTTTPDGWVMGWAGKAAAGRLLDGRTHDGFPAC